MQITIHDAKTRLRLTATERRALTKAQSILAGIRIAYPEVTLSDVLARLDDEGVMEEEGEDESE